MNLHQPTQMGFIFVLKIFQDKCNCKFNRDYFQCNWSHCDLFIRNWLHL